MNLFNILYFYSIISIFNFFKAQTEVYLGSRYTLKGEWGKSQKRGAFGVKQGENVGYLQKERQPSFTLVSALACLSWNSWSFHLTSRTDWSVVSESLGLPWGLIPLGPTLQPWLDCMSALCFLAHFHCWLLSKSSRIRGDKIVKLKHSFLGEK